MTEITSFRGDAVSDGNGVRADFHRHYPNPTQDVWSAVTEPEMLGRWIGTWTGTARPEVTDLAGDLVGHT